MFVCVWSVQLVVCVELLVNCVQLYCARGSANAAVVNNAVSTPGSALRLSANGIDGQLLQLVRQLARDLHVFFQVYYILLLLLLLLLLLKITKI